MKKHIIKRSQKLEAILDSDFQINDLRPVLGVFHFDSLIKTGQVSSSVRARTFTKKALKKTLDKFNHKLFVVRNTRRGNKFIRPVKPILERLNNRLIGWGFTVRKVAANQKLEAIWVKSESAYKNGRWTTITHAESWINVPLGFTRRMIGHAITILSTHAAKQTAGVVRCHWVEDSLGSSFKLVKGFLHLDSGTHAKTIRGLKQSISRQMKAKEKEAALKGLSDQDILDQLRKNTKKVSLIGASTACGNCKVGTIEFLSHFNIAMTRKTAKIGAIVRLATMKGLQNDHYFMRALRYAF
mgnify:CR=1 FL=1